MTIQQDFDEGLRAENVELRKELETWKKKAERMQLQFLKRKRDVLLLGEALSRPRLLGWDWPTIQRETGVEKPGNRGLRDQP